MRRAAPSLASKVRALVAGKTKDTASINRDGALTTTTVSCLTSSSDFAVATSASGLLVCDSDNALINTLTVREKITLACLEDVTPVGLADAKVRTIIVWFKKPLLVASAAGTLPPVTEVLETDDFNSLYVTDTRNAGRFQVISDRTVSLGCNTVAVAATGAYPRVNGTNVHCEEYVIKINKKTHFKDIAVDGGAAGAGGHYDSDVPEGQVDNGLLIMYTLGLNAATAGTTSIARWTRVNYTA